MEQVLPQKPLVIWTIAGFVWPALTILGFKLSNTPFEPIAAIFGITTCLLFLSSPFLFGFALQACWASFSKSNAMLLLASSIYLVLVALFIYKLWPALQGV